MQFLKTKEVANIFGCTQRNVALMVKAGKLKPVNNHKDFFLFDADLKLVYRGQLDDSRPGNGLPVDGADLLHAVQCMIENKANARPQKPSIGCNIKWKTS